MTPVIIATPLEGRRFGRLVAVEKVGRDKSGNARWLCRCDCGGETIAAATDLRRGRTRSCGAHNPARRQHGASQSPEHRAWRALFQRCENRNIRSYRDYGGRGIRICDRWRESFVAFLDDVGKRPSARHSLERLDNDGDYAPGNVRWALPHEQAANRRTTKLTPEKAREIVDRVRKGEAQAQVAREMGVAAVTVYGVISGRAWTKATGIPRRPRRAACSR